MFVVDNIKNRQYKELSELREFKICRPEILGNPYPVKKYGREGCIARYRTWLFRKIREKNPEVVRAILAIEREYKLGRNVVLLCWCAPEECHGDVIIDLIRTWNEDFGF